MQRRWDFMSIRDTMKKEEEDYIQLADWGELMKDLERINKATAEQRKNKMDKLTEKIKKSKMDIMRKGGDLSKFSIDTNFIGGDHVSVPKGALRKMIAAAGVLAMENSIKSKKSREKYSDEIESIYRFIELYVDLVI